MLQKLKVEYVTVYIRMATVATAINVFAGFSHTHAQVNILILLCRSQHEHLVHQDSLLRSTQRTCSHSQTKSAKPPNHINPPVTAHSRVSLRLHHPSV